MLRTVVLKLWTQKSNIGITWELSRTRNCWIPPQMMEIESLGMRIMNLHRNKPSGDCDTGLRLRTASLDRLLLSLEQILYPNKKIFHFIYMIKLIGIKMQVAYIFNYLNIFHGCGYIFKLIACVFISIKNILGK